MTEKRFKLNEPFFKQIDANNYVIIPILDNGKELSVVELVELLNELHEWNNHLEEHLNIVRSHRDILISKNKELQERNNRQCKQLDNLYKLIEHQDWYKLNSIIQELKEADERLQEEWGAYGDFE